MKTHVLSQFAYRHFAFVPLAAALAALSVPAQAALTFTTAFDSSVSAAARIGITNALSEYSALFSDNVNVSLKFVNTGNGLGTSSTYSFGVDYQTYHNALIADGSSATDFSALGRLAVDGGGVNNPVTGSGFIFQGRAGLAALGIGVDTSGIANYFDGVIDLNLALMNLDRINIDADKYDLKAVTQHEVDEVLGTISNMGQADPRPIDLFRYTNSGNRTFTTAGDNAYFSVNGTTLLARFNQDPGGDYGDFWSAFGGNTPQVQDAFSTPGATPNLGAEIAMLDAVGWTLIAAAVPEPGTWALALAGGLFVFGVKRRAR